MKKWACLVSVLLVFFSHTALAIKVYNKGDPDVNRVAITVDDCFSIPILVEMLDLFEAEQIRVTIFPIGSEIQAADRAVWERVLASGHEIGNHTQTHRKLTNLSSYEVGRQMLRAQRSLNEALGYEYKMTLMRPPYGSYKENNTLRRISRAGYSHVIMWSINQLDPQKALKQMRNGSIFLYHTNRRDLKSLTVLIPLLKDAGYEMVTVSELLNLQAE